MNRSQAMNTSKIRTYANTVLEFKECADGVVDLRAELGERERALLSGLGLDCPFAVLTAHNPYGSSLQTGNEERQEDLQSMLRKEAEHSVPVDGCSPDRRHREASIAACILEHRARAIAIRFEQDAYFWFDGDTFYLVGADQPPSRVRLPLEKRRLARPQKPDFGG